MAVLLRGKADRRRIDDGQQFFQVLAEQVKVQRLVAILQRAEENVFFQRVVIAKQVAVAALGLLLDAQYRRCSQYSPHWQQQARP